MWKPKQVNNKIEIKTDKGENQKSKKPKEGETKIGETKREEN